jgi:lysozyme
MTKNLIDTLKRHEGLMLKPYRCTANKLTIGYGRNLEARGITREEAEMLLENDIKLCLAQLKERVSFWDKLPVAVQEVLVNMAFNLGINGLLNFKKTMAMIQRGDYKGASVEMLNSNWARQVGNRAVELSNVMKRS